MRTIELEFSLPPNAYKRDDPNECFHNKVMMEDFCEKTLSALYRKIDEHNSGTTILITKDCAALHVFGKFTLQECVKNSLDARATHLHISIVIAEDEMVTVVMSDNGTGTEDEMRSYKYCQAFFSKSEKEGDRNQHGGNKKGLAMSAQYLALFNGSGNRLDTGKSIQYEIGFSVQLVSNNKSVDIKWDDYFSEFEESCGGYIAFVRTGDTAAQPQIFSRIESELQKKLKEVKTADSRKKDTPLESVCTSRSPVQPRQLQRRPSNLFVLKPLKPPTPLSSSDDIFPREPSTTEVSECRRDESDSPLCDVQRLFA